MILVLFGFEAMSSLRGWCGGMGSMASEDVHYSFLSHEPPRLDSILPHLPLHGMTCAACWNDIGGLLYLIG